jgi:TrmH family RNA methyltransferase
VPAFFAFGPRTAREVQVTKGVLSSPANERVRYARSLHRERVRCREKRFIIEGTRLVEEALRAGATPALSFYTGRLPASERGRALLAALMQTGAPVLEVTPEVMATMAETVTPQGVLAIMPRREEPWPAHGLVVVLDGLRDPGNAGTILRTAWAAGASGVAAMPGTVDLYAPKVLRSAMGAHFHLRLQAGVQACDLPALLADRRVLLAAPQGRPYWDVDWPDDCALVIGGEARGSEVAAPLAEESVAIPMAAGVESLNAAIAAGVLLFEARRRRGSVKRQT